MKVTHELRMRTHCTGCGVSWNVCRLLGPHEFETIGVKVISELLMIDYMELKKKRECPICLKQSLKKIDWFEEPKDTDK